MQSGEILPDYAEADDGQADPARAPEPAAPERSSVPTIAATLLFAVLLLGGLYALAMRQHQKYEAWLDADPVRRRKHEKAKTKRAGGGNED